MKKIVAPAVIVAVILAYIAFILVMVLAEPGFASVAVGKIIAIVVATLVAGALIAVLVQRIKEIRKGVEDDLGKY